MSSELESSTFPQENPDFQDGSSSITEIDTNETGERVNELLEGQTKLPPHVREEAEKLFVVLEARLQQLRQDERWKKTDDEKAMLIRLGGILQEYSSTTQELQIRMKNPQIFQQLKKYLEEHSALSQQEERVLELLEKEYIGKGPRKPHARVEQEQRQYMVAAGRLRRKRTLSSYATAEFARSIGMHSTVLLNWEKNMQEEDGTPTPTEKLVSNVFERARKELNPTAAAEESVPEEIAAAHTGIEQPASSIALSTGTPEETAVAEPSAVMRETAADDLMAQLLNQYKDIADILRGTEANSEVAKACGQILQDYRVLLSQILSNQSGHGIDSPVSIKGNEITLSPAVYADIKVGAIVATARVKDDMGSHTSEIQLRGAQ